MTSPRYVLAPSRRPFGHSVPESHGWKSGRSTVSTRLAYTLPKKIGQTTHQGEAQLPNTKSAQKQVRVQERRRLRNKAVRSATRTHVRKAEVAILAGETNATADS